MQTRLFGDFAYNFQGDSRTRDAYNTNPGAFPGLTGPVDGQNKAYQAGIGIGTAGPVYGPTQGLVYWQHIEQYALDVNLLDADFLLKAAPTCKAFTRHLWTKL